jgi:tRNA threonylcarbamoyl adenosine modification protein (Sua5/YciO/YrdC/YwlC family)
MNYLGIHPDNPEGRKIRQAAEALADGAVIVYPTDTVYALGCAIDQHGAVDRICRIRGIERHKARFSIICSDISQASEFATPLDNRVFRMMKKNTPGPFTFILPASNTLPRILKERRKNIGIRIPDNKIALALLEQLNKPIISASFYSEDDIQEYVTDPFEISSLLANQIDVIIDGGPGGLDPSTVIDCTGPTPEVIRQGVGRLR